MRTPLARRLDRANHGVQPPERKREVDTSGMTPADAVLHAVQSHGLASLLDGMAPLDITRPLPGTTDITSLLMPAKEHRPSRKKPETPPPPPVPEAPAPWYEEYAYWRPRGPRDVYDTERTDEPALWEEEAD